MKQALKKSQIENFSIPLNLATKLFVASPIKSSKCVLTKATYNKELITLLHENKFKLDDKFISMYYLYYLFSNIFFFFKIIKRFSHK